MLKTGLYPIESKEELRSFYTKILEKYKGQQYHIIGDIDSWEKIDPVFLKQYRLNRAQAGIKTKILLSHSSKPHNPDDKSLLREYKYLPKEYVFENTVDIFDDYGILIVSPSAGALAIIIAIPAVVDVFRSIFDIIWEEK